MTSSSQPDIIDPADGEPLSFDDTVRRARAFCDTLPEDFAQSGEALSELQTRLSKGRLHFAVLGQFNRGKSTFINALLRIKTLPTSVLPLTSVPTIIEYGATQSCTIRFLDGREELVVTESLEKMEATLRQYVAEANNPKNRYQVKDAVITCASELLVSGTTLIDTPGFGSTHLHNTRTTLDLLIECDAAFFLLSVDPPMTQAEMEFLRMVKEHVPKLYFVLNKVDLLPPAELDEVDRFIKNILMGELGFPQDTVLYRVCAIKGGCAKTADPKDPDWQASGLDAIKKETLDFMAREKYFTLSEALSDKYKEIMGETKTRLEKKLEQIIAPISAARQEIAAVTSAIQVLSLELNSQEKRLAAEKSAVDAAISSQEEEDSAAFAISMKTALDVLLGDKYFPSEAASIASTLLPKHSNDLGARMLVTMIATANKSIRASVVVHTMALTNLQKRYAEYLNVNAAETSPATNTPPMPTPDELITHLEIGPVDRDKIFNLADFPIPQPQITDIFRKKTARFEAIREFYEPLCAESISKNIETASKTARTLIDEAWGKMSEAVRGAYLEMINEMAKLQKTKQSALDKEGTAVKTEVAFLRDKIKEIGTYGF